MSSSKTSQLTKELCEIIQKVITRLYQERSRPVQVTRLAEDMHDRLEQWFEQIPPQLKVDISNLPTHCPPPHIISVKYASHRVRGDADFQCTISGCIHSCKPGLLAERSANQDQGRAGFRIAGAVHLPPTGGRASRPVPPLQQVFQASQHALHSLLEHGVFSTLCLCLLQ